MSYPCRSWRIRKIHLDSRSGGRTFHFRRFLNQTVRRREEVSSRQRCLWWPQTLRRAGVADSWLWRGSVVCCCWVSSFFALSATNLATYLQSKCLNSFGHTAISIIFLSEIANSAFVLDPKKNKRRQSKRTRTRRIS